MKRYAIFAALTLVTSGIVGLGCSSGSDTSDDEAFLETVRDQAASSASVSTEVGGITPGGTKAKIELQADSFDMGVISNSEVAVQRMKVYNRGDAPLKIDRVTTSCPCTTGEMERNLIPPNGEADLIIRVDPKKIPGFFADKVLTLMNNDPITPAPTIHVLSHVEPEIELSPEAFEFDVVDYGEGGSRTIRVRQLQDDLFEIDAIALGKDNPFMEVEKEVVPETTWRTAGKREYDLTVRIKPDAPVGKLEDWVWISSNLRRATHLPIKFTAEVAGSYEIIPREVTARGMAPGEEKHFVVVLRSHRPLTVLDFTNTNEAVHLFQNDGNDSNTYLLGFSIPERTSSRSIRDTWTIAFEVDGKRYDETIPVSIVLTRDQ